MNINVSNNGSTLNVTEVRLWVDGNVGMIHIDSEPVGTTKHQQQVGSTLEIRLVPLEGSMLVVNEADCTKVFVDFGLRLVEKIAIVYEPEMKNAYVENLQLGEPTVTWTPDTGSVYA